MSEFFNIQEVEKCRRLQAILACLLFYCFLVFRSWGFQAGFFAESIDTLNFMPMWPVEHFPWRPLMPASIHQRVFTLLAYLSLAGSCLVFLGKRIPQAFYLLVVLTATEFVYYLHDLRMVANFFHVHLYLTAYFVFSKQKLMFFRVGLWQVYWLAALVKLTPSWLWGEYFNSVPARLPLFPSYPAVVTGASLLLLIVELLSPLLWLSSNKNHRLFSAVVLLLFHLYSGVIVGHWYTTLMTPLVLLALFPFEKPLFADYQKASRHRFMWAFFAISMAGGLFNYFIPGDVRTTGEGRYHGLFMFDANRRVVAEIEVEIAGDKDNHRFAILYDWPRKEVLDWQTSVQYSRNNGPFYELRAPVRVNQKVIFNPDYFRRNSSRIFGDPYVFYYYATQLQNRFFLGKLRLTVDQQLDGHSYSFRVLDLNEGDALRIRYNPFGRNEWIRLPGPRTPEAYQWP